MSFFNIVETIDKDICSLFPPHIDNFKSAIVNLPIILLYILSLPPRTFLCVLSSLTNIPLYGLIANFLPPSTLFCSWITGNSNTCFPCCPSCKNNAECIQLPKFFVDFCQKAKPYFSIPNQIFCLIGYILTVMLTPVTELVNLVLVPTGRQLCLAFDVNNCFPGD